MNNLGLKILALVISAMLWLIVINNTDPVTEKLFTGVTVEMENENSLLRENKVYDILENSGVVNVTIYAPRSVLDTITKDDIHAVADLSEISISDTVEISVYSDRSNDQIERIYLGKDTLKLYIENAMTAQLLITPVIEGKVADGYIVGDVTTSQNIVRITGPESIVSTLQKEALVTVDVSGMTSSISTDVEIKLYDVDGNLVTKTNVNKNISTVNVNATILATKTVPLVYNTMGDVAKGYILNGEIISNPDTVMIAGVKNVIDGIPSIEIPAEELNVVGQSTDMMQLIDVTKYLPTGVRLANSEYSGKATVTVGIDREVDGTISYDEQAIIIKNVPTDFKVDIVEIPDDLTLKLAGRAGVLNALKQEDIVGTIDMQNIQEDYNLEEYKEGNFTTQVSFTLPDGVILTSPVNVHVIFEKK